MCTAGVSKVDSRYFANEDGKTFVPVGCNICFPRMYDAASSGSRAECEERFFGWLRKFAANGGNFTRIWLGHSFFEIMPERAGEYDPAAEATLKRTVKLCEELGIKLKLTLESFRTVHPAGKEGSGMYSSFFNRPLYAPYAKNMREFLHSEECERIYLGKAPNTIVGEKVPFVDGFKCYLPWENRWMNVERGAVLPDFTRSIVVRIPTRSFE